MYMDKGILGCRYGSARPRFDIPLIVDLYRAGLLKLDELISKTYPLDEFETALDDLRRGELARGVLAL
jgi:S-(hydroxymethyl)glutathione dehydrogenase/alcohol dehydrogenase